MTRVTSDSIVTEDWVQDSSSGDEAQTMVGIEEYCKLWLQSPHSYLKKKN